MDRRLLLPDIGQSIGAIAGAEYPETGAVGGEYDFLVPDFVDVRSLSLAIANSARSGVLAHHLLIAQGALTRAGYIAALEGRIRSHGNTVNGSRHPPAPRGSIWIDGLGDRPSVVMAEAQAARQRGLAVLIGDVPPLDAGLEGQMAVKRAEAAANDFTRRFPLLAAKSAMPVWQILAAAILFGLFVGGAVVAPEATLFAGSAGLAMLFVIIVGVRLVALYALSGPRPMGISLSVDAADAGADSRLPRYTVIVPLFREADVLPDLVEALRALDYPISKLEILLVLEAIDTETLAAARRMILPPNFRVLAVPDCAPRTKPKALNYALFAARGDYIAVFDAEDLPEPDQLRKAVQAFRRGGPNLACLQARLNIHNPRDSWLSSQFAIEYSALFDGFLPALTKLRMPLPLGGTSNHFPVRLLRRAGGWDAYNVTEDADLGFRIARLGGRIAFLDSTTWEEAPARLGPWFRQRTRWLKGWIITYLVHMRRPRLLLRQLGLWRFIGLQVVLGGMLLSAFIHPLFYILLAVGLWDGFAFQSSGSPAGDVLLAVAAGNLIAGYGSAVLLAGASVIRRRRAWLIWHLALMPIYWLLVSFAAYRALWQAVRAPFLWEKTPHRARRRAAVWYRPSGRTGAGP